MIKAVIFDLDNTLCNSNRYFKYNNRGNIDIKGIKPDYTETNYKDILKLIKSLTLNQ